MKKLNKIFNKMNVEQKKEFRAKLYGISIKKLDELERVSKDSEQFINLPIERWPAFQIRWDLNPENYHYAIGINKEEVFNTLFPNGVILAWADLLEIDSILTRQSQRSVDEIWTIGDPLKTAKIILYWNEGNAMTPSFIELYNADNNFLSITGGNHRLAVCRAKGESRVPFLTLPEYKNRINELLKTIEWK